MASMEGVVSPSPLIAITTSGWWSQGQELSTLFSASPPPAHHHLTPACACSHWTQGPWGPVQPRSGASQVPLVNWP